MCFRPINITANKFFGSTRVIPCGECEECNSKRANDIYVRMRMEYSACEKNGGNAFMTCLTYSDETLPYFAYNGKKYKVFNKLGVIKFIKRLRMRLDREYRSRYGEDAPDFKYCITSEYGTDPTKTQRPHYHGMFFFKSYVEPTIFEKCFRSSTNVYKCCGNYTKIIPQFGHIMQCDLFDPKRGGIKYSGKYICKDITYEKQNEIIRNLIQFYKDKINAEFGINDEDDDELVQLKNRAIRSRKEYKKAVAENIRPLRHMLQFYMVSNDLGATACINKYGKILEQTPLINFDGFPYRLPRIIKDRYEQIYGYKARKNMDKANFIQSLSNVLYHAKEKQIISWREEYDLKEFAKAYLMPVSGVLTLVTPDDVNNLDNNLSPVEDWQSIINRFKFFDDNDFYVIRDKINHLINVYNSPENLGFRSRIAIAKAEEKKKVYEQRKRNKYGN